MVISNSRLSAEVIEDILENNYNDTCFCSFSKHLAIFGEFLKLYNTSIICMLSLVNRKGKITKDLLFYLFLKLVRMNLMFSNNEHIYIHNSHK